MIRICANFLQEAFLGLLGKAFCFIAYLLWGCFIYIIPLSVTPSDFLELLVCVFWRQLSHNFPISQTGWPGYILGKQWWVGSWYFEESMWHKPQSRHWATLKFRVRSPECPFLLAETQVSEVWTLMWQLTTRVGEALCQAGSSNLVPC